MKKVYLACPYSHELPGVRASRKVLADCMAAHLMQDGHIVFSPLSHSHSVADYLPESLRCNWEFWAKQDLPLVDWADEVHVLCLPGWDDSPGVQAEIARAKGQGKGIVYHEEEL